jgi:hypothetical protein
MKHLRKFNESQESIEDELFNLIENCITSEIYLRDVPHSLEDGAQELDPISIKDAVKCIISKLKNKGIL